MRNFSSRFYQELYSFLSFLQAAAVVLECNCSVPFVQFLALSHHGEGRELVSSRMFCLQTAKARIIRLLAMLYFLYVLFQS